MDRRKPQFLAVFGAPQPMKMGTIASPWRYDAAVRRALQSPDLRHPAVLRYVLAGAARPFLAAIVIQEPSRGRVLRGQYSQRVPV